jgi:multiple sugar transport system substrate-binding protein
VKTGVIFKDAKNKAGAKKFVSLPAGRANLTPYVEGSLGRWFPVRRKASRARSGRPTRTAGGLQPVHGRHDAVRVHQELQVHVLNNENVWAKAMNRVLSEKVPVDKAVDEMIARIKTVAN